MLHKKIIFIAFIAFELFIADSLLLAANDTANDALQPDSAKECAICHYIWVDTFFIENKGTELAVLPEHPVAASSEMCFSCHDGSTVDSRKKLESNRMHQTGTIPSDNVVIPEVFPLDEDGRMDCATCHSAHSLSSEAGIERTIFLRTSNENSNMCKMCHVDKLGGTEQGNHPVDKISIKTDRNIIKYGGHTGSEKNQVICESCHTAHGGFTDNRLVMPVDSPSRHPVLCEQCHGKTPGLSKDKTRNHYSHSVDVIPDNAEIPVRWKNGEKVILGSKGQLLCVSCHSVHNPLVNKSLMREKNDKDSLCMQCHPSQKKAIKETKHDLNISAPDAVNIFGENISQSGPCSSCHLMHEGTGPFMWARPLAGIQQPSIEICESCHKKGGCAEKSLIPDTGHPIGISLNDPNKKVEYPLFTVTGKKSGTGEIYCSSCHNTHQWDPVNPDNKGAKDQDGDFNNSFLRASYNESGLCLGCHKEQGAVLGTDHDLALSAPDLKNMLGQSPAESGLCGSCHLAHGGLNSLMWARGLDNVDDNEPFLAQICLECHDDSNCGNEKQIGEKSHPIGVALLKPLNTDLPLYNKKGDKDNQDGLVYCSTCHDSHQWNPANPKIKGEEGTLSDSFLRLTCNGPSHLCIECHKDQMYVECTDHDMRVSCPVATNKQDIKREEDAICFQCHNVHNALSDAFIFSMAPGPPTVAKWDKEFNPSGTVMIGVCTSCHQEGQCAEAKIPEYGLHPPEIYVDFIQNKYNSASIKQSGKFIDDFPVFSDSGNKSIDGNIVCSTCHDSHIWNARHLQKGPCEKADGNVTNSFLRKNIPNTFCAACHGEEALYKFKFFHKIKSRK